MSDPDKERGLYQKYFVQRLPEGCDTRGLALVDLRKTGTMHADVLLLPPQKHEKCPYFVLDLVHDKHARYAANVYALSCQDEYPALAKSLWEKLDETWQAANDAGVAP
jgi:hypothetical protein